MYPLAEVTYRVDSLSLLAVLALVFGVLVLVGVVALIIALARKGGAAALFVVFGFLAFFGFAFFLLMFTARMDYKTVSVQAQAENYLAPPRGSLPAPAIDLGTVAEVDENSFDSSAELSETSAIAVATPKISRAEINLSTIPDNHPEWVDETESNWNEDAGLWTKTVMIGPFENEGDIKREFVTGVHEATKDFARWHAASIAHVDETIANYKPGLLPTAKANLDINCRSRRENDYEIRKFRNSHVRETYQTKVQTGVSDEPWHVMFARVEFDRDFRKQVDQAVRHRLSLKRAVQAGSIWVAALLGMVVTLGGLKVIGKTAPEISPNITESITDAPASTEITPRFWTSHRRNLIIAPLICTAIYATICLLDGDEHYFWPAWVWLGCSIGLVMTFLSTTKK